MPSGISANRWLPGKKAVTRSKSWSASTTLAGPVERGPLSILESVQLERSQELFDRAQLSIPGGVNSPVRAWRGVGGTPRFINRGEGSHLFDEDGNEYIDYIGSWGPLLL